MAKRNRIISDVPKNKDEELRNMLTLAVGSFAEKLTEGKLSDVARPHYQNAFDLASQMLDDLR